MLSLLEIRDSESGPLLVGTAITYNVPTARIAGGIRERVAAGSFGDLSASDVDVVLNAHHDSRRPLARTPETLRLFDSLEELRIEASLPPTRDAEDVITQVRADVLRGLSIEFRIRSESWDGNLRTITRADLSGIGVVSRPAYRLSRPSIRTCPVDIRGFL